MIIIKQPLNFKNLSFSLLVIYVLFFSKSIFGKSINTYDDLGNELFLENPASRIIVLGPNLVEIFFSIGVGSKIIGVDEASDYPIEVKKIKKIASYNSINYEEIASLSPDLIFMWSTGFSFSKIKKLKDLGIPVYLSQPKKILDIEKLIRSAGYLTGNTRLSDEVASKFVDELNTYKKKYEHKTKIPVFYQVWDEPLQTLNGDHIVSDIIELCGGINIFNSMHEIAPKVTIESVILNNPSVILIGAKGKSKNIWLDNWSNWQIINAVKNNQIFIINPDLVVRESPRIIQGVEEVCDILDKARTD
tara:strand:- start:329 stop:1240 length:912 start_codon:yes stop_codon:yes gene_type:complete